MSADSRGGLSAKPKAPKEAPPKPAEKPAEKPAREDRPSGNRPTRDKSRRRQEHDDNRVVGFGDHVPDFMT